VDLTVTAPEDAQAVDLGLASQDVVGIWGGLLGWKSP
jgi:hypothetical protein